MSAESVWQSEVRRLWEETKTIWECFNKIDEDMYKGRGPLNPPITQRTAALETRVTSLELAQKDATEESKKRQKEIRVYLCTILAAIVGDLVKNWLVHVFGGK